MRNRGILLGATLAVGLLALTGCDNTQGTSATPEMLHETTSYSNGGDSQNTGAGSGMMLKPAPVVGARMGGDTPSQALVKGTDSATGDFPASLTGPGSGVTTTHPTAPPAKPTHDSAPASSGTAAPPPVAPGVEGTPMIPATPPIGAPGTGAPPPGPGAGSPTP